MGLTATKRVSERRSEHLLNDLLVSQGWELRRPPNGDVLFQNEYGMPPGKLRAQVAKKARSLMENPHPPGCKKLVNLTSGGEPVWRVRAGNYRILYVCRQTEVVVIDIGDRKDVYR